MQCLFDEKVEDATTKHDDRRSPFIVSNIAHPQGKRNQCCGCARPVCTAQRKTPRSLFINDNCTINNLVPRVYVPLGQRSGTVRFPFRWTRVTRALGTRLYYKTINAAERMLEDPQPKQCFVCATFAQNKGNTLCSLFVFTQLFRTRNKKRRIFRSVHLGF